MFQSSSDLEEASVELLKTPYPFRTSNPLRQRYSHHAEDKPTQNIRWPVQAKGDASRANNHHPREAY